jgi:hypothetical protein
MWIRASGDAKMATIEMAMGILGMEVHTRLERKDTAIIIQVTRRIFHQR